MIILHSVLYATTYYVDNSNPNDEGNDNCEDTDYPCYTISDAIDLAEDDDPEDSTLILVSPGTYLENLRIESDMIIRALTNADGDSTFINGAVDYKSVILIRPQTMSTDKPVVTIDGFVILNGIGTEILEHIYTNNDDIPDESNMIRVGGGVFAYVCSPTITNCIFMDNGNDGDGRTFTTGKGGGIMASGDKEDMDFPAGRNYTDHDSLSNAVGPLDLSNNVFINQLINWLTMLVKLIIKTYPFIPPTLYIWPFWIHLTHPFPKSSIA